MKQVPTPFEPPVVPGFTHKKLLAVSTRSAVHLALDSANRMVVLKTLRIPSGVDRKSWGSRWSELQKISANQEGLLPVLDFGEVGGESDAWFYIMPPADDASDEAAGNLTLYNPLTLRLRLKVGGPLPITEVINLGHKLASGLEQLHLARLVHRDVKPSNVFFVNAESRIGDFDLMLSPQNELIPRGTEGFYPLEEQPTPATDVFALGKTLYEAWTGLDRLEFPSLPPGLAGSGEWLNHGAALNRLLLKACASRAGDRFTNAAEFRVELDRLLPTAVKRTQPVKVMTWRTLGVGLALLVLASFIGWWLIRPHQLPGSQVSEKAYQSLDLKPFYNARHDHTWQHGWYGIREDGPVMPNHLGSLTAGRHILDTIPFDVHGLIQLNGTKLAEDARNNFPQSITNIIVNRSCRALHFLQAVAHRAKAGETVGRYRIHFKDGGTEEWPLIFGKNTADWWRPVVAQIPADGPRVAWRGQNEVAQRFVNELVLYHDIWTNTVPQREVISLDFISDMTVAGPMLLAVTAE